VRVFGWKQLTVPEASAREWLGLRVIALPCLVYSMDLMALDLALPAMGSALRPTSAQLLWCSTQ